MAIEDHPQFKEWSAALTLLYDAWNEYNWAKMRGENDALLVGLEGAFLGALREFRRLSDEIDA